MQSITRMYPSTLINPLLCEADLVSASRLLNHHQRQYVYQLLSLLDQHLAKNILLISLRKGEGDFQPGELPESHLMWMEKTRPILYWQWLVWQITIEHLIDPTDGVEPIETMKQDKFQGTIVIQSKKNIIKEARKYRPSLVMWIDGSKLDQCIGAAVCWREKTCDLWKKKGVFLGKNKEILDTEL